MKQISFSVNQKHIHRTVFEKYIGLKKRAKTFLLKNPNIWISIPCPQLEISLRCWDKSRFEGFPGGAVVENLPANAGDTGSSPGLGRSHMPRSNWAHEPQLVSLRVWSLCSATREAATVRGPRTAMKSGPRLPQLEKALAQETKTQQSHK